MEERLQKLLSRYGIASRRHAEQMIQDGRVRVNGNTAVLGGTADIREDVVEVDGVPLGKTPSAVYIMLNKPRGYVTTLQDERGRKSVADLVAACGQRVYPVGRLDLYSEGLLLLTNDGALANGLTHPKDEIQKVYQVWVSGYRPGAEKSLAEPIWIDGRETKPAQVRLQMVRGDVAMFWIVLTEGRNRQIRRLCQRAGLTVTRLKRTGEGPLRLGALAVGKWRYLEDGEIRALQQAYGLPFERN